MDIKKTLLVILPLASVLVQAPVEAFSVDKMIVVADDNSNGVLTLINDEKRPIFINSKIEEVNIENGDDIQKKLYSRENIEDWKVSLTHRKLVLKPDEEKTVGIRGICAENKCANDRDLMFLLSFYPSSYSDGANSSAVEINYGFAPIYVIPTKKPRFSYEINNQGEQLHVKNDSNTMINLFVNACSANKTKTGCKQKFIILAGREKTFSLPETMRSENLDVTVTSHDRRYSEKHIAILRGK